MWPGNSNRLGYVLHHEGKYVEARQFLKRSLEMYERLYPKNQYPQGHPELASLPGRPGRPT